MLEPFTSTAKPPVEFTLAGTAAGQMTLVEMVVEHLVRSADQPSVLFMTMLRLLQVGSGLPAPIWQLVAEPLPPSDGQIWATMVVGPFQRSTVAVPLATFLEKFAVLIERPIGPGAGIEPL